MGHTGSMFIAIAVMISTYGLMAACILSAPRLTYAFSAQGDFPDFLSRLHVRYQTPALSIIIFATLLWLLSVTGSFLWLIAVTGGSMAIEYIGMCAALIRLRKIQPNVDAVRVPWGPALAVLGIVICVTLLTRLEPRELLLMSVVAVIGIGNWRWATHRTNRGSPRPEKIPARA
jgi:basic amino acid/polyamine antiporter, APA family